MTGEHGVEREARTVEWVLRQRKNWWFSLNNGCSLKSGPVGGGAESKRTDMLSHTFVDSFLCQARC